MSNLLGLLSLAVSLFLSLSVSTSAHGRGAQPLPKQDDATAQALQQTQEGLTNPAARAKMLEGDQKAQALDSKVKSTLGSQSESAYQLSSELMQTLVQKTGGDAGKMQELVQQLMANPQMIEQYLTPAQREKIRAMAGKLESEKKLPRASGSGK